jgi:hypothetical protein
LITADAFWTAVGSGGVIVDVNGREENDQLIATELTLEFDEN